MTGVFPQAEVESGVSGPKGALALTPVPWPSAAVASGMVVVAARIVVSASRLILGVVREVEEEEVGDLWEGEGRGF